MKSGDLLRCFPSPVASPFSPGNLALRNTQISQRVFQPFRIVTQVAIGRSNERFQTNIDADSSLRLMRNDSACQEFPASSRHTIFHSPA
jgi:hypothetical protein